MKTMRQNLFLLGLSLALLLPASSWAEEKNPDEETAERADAAYASQDYRKAMGAYETLARKGDPFSQYRMSYMHLVGEGVDVDYPEAFAWSVLAAESKIEQLETYFQEVKQRVPEDQQDAAQKLAEDYLQRWGRMALAIEARKKADQQLRNCTGSRLGTRCDEVYALEMPKFWKINPGDGSGADGGSASPSGSVSSMQVGAGAEKRDAEHYAELREARDQLDNYISTQGGTVELGEFEVVEPESEDAPSESSQNR